MFKRTFPMIWLFEQGLENPWCEKVGLNMHVQTDLSEDLAFRQASKSLVRKGRLKTRTFKRTFPRIGQIVKNECENSPELGAPRLILFKPTFPRICTL